MSIDKVIQALTEMKEKWGDIDIRVEKEFSTGAKAYLEPWLAVTKPANTSTNYIVIR